MTKQASYAVVWHPFFFVNGAWVNVFWLEGADQVAEFLVRRVTGIWKTLERGLTEIIETRIFLQFPLTLAPSGALHLLVSVISSTRNPSCGS